MFTWIRSVARISKGVFAVLASMAFVGGWFVSCRPCVAQESILVASPSAQAAEQKIRAALRQRISLVHREKPLSEIVDELGKALSINVRLDTKVLTDAGIDASALPITLRAQDVTAEAALSAILQAQGLFWTIADEALLITTREQADVILHLRVYLVRDLVATKAEESGIEDADPLIELITGTVATQTWSELGGPGTLDYFSNAGVLAVAQTREAHDEIEQLLAMLRKARGLQGIRPAVEVATDVSPSDFVLSSPPTRLYSAPPSWNLPQVHR